MTVFPLAADGKPATTIVLAKEPTRAAKLGLTRTRPRRRTVHHSAARELGRVVEQAAMGSRPAGHAWGAAVLAR